MKTGNRRIRNRDDHSLRLPTLIVTVLVVCILVWPHIIFAQTVTFGLVANLSGGGGSSSHSVLADFNRDGKLDLAEASSGFSMLFIRLGDGLGSFGDVSSIDPALGSLTCLIAGDFNQDGKLDLATCHQFGVTVFLGDGTGAFPTASTLEVLNLVSAAATDFNRDGKLDLVVINTESINGLPVSHLGVHFGDGTGAFTSGTLAPGPANGSLSSLALGDFNRDGRVDAAATNGDTSRVSIYLANAAGSFETPTLLPAISGGLGSIVSIDLNRDGNLDLVTWNAQDLSTLLGSANGAFGAATTFPLGAGPREMTVSDMNGDGILDLSLVMDQGGDVTGESVLVLTGNGAGSFAGSPTSVPLSGGFAVATGDLNRDGRPDLVVSKTTGISVLFNTTAFRPAGSFAPATNFGVGDVPRAVAAADLNRDGRLDLAVVNSVFPSNSVSILLGDGSGSFTGAAGSPLAVGDTPKSVAVGDLNRDGILDLAVANGNSGTVSILLGNGAGGFTTAAGSPLAVGSLPTSVGIADFNRDGKLDLAVTRNLANTLHIFLGDGSGGFGEASGSPETVGNGPASVEVGDLNRDGALDVVVGNSGGGTVSILLGNGMGDFAEATGSPISVLSVSTNDPFGLALSDLDRDGDLDLTVADLTNFRVVILLGDGAGGFVAALGSPLTAGSDPRWVAIGDLNRDGIPDLAVPNGGTDTVSFFLGDGASGFAAAPASPVDVGDGPLFLAVGDFNRDGRLDLVTANGSSNNISVLLNNPPEITSVSDTTVQAGAALTIAGTGFGSTQGSSVLTIGGVAVPAGNILSWSDTEIVAIVPAGAEGTNRAVSLTVNGQASNPQTLTSVTPGIASLTISPTNPTIAVGQTQPFTITANMTDGTMQTVTMPVPYGIKILAGAQRAVAIDPATGSVTPTGPELSTFTGASAGPSALDVQGGRGYVIIGGNLITVDTANEIVLSTNPMPIGVSSLEFDPVQNRLLGVALIGGVNTLVQVTPAGDGQPATVTPISTGAVGFPAVSAGVSAFDPSEQHYYVSLAGSLVTFDQTGTVVFNAPFLGVSSMEYDAGEHRLFGVTLVSGVNKLVEVARSFGPDSVQLNDIGAGSLPGPSNVSAGVATLDPDNNLYYVSFAGQIHTINTSTGSVASAPFSGVSSLLFHPLLRSDNPAVATVAQNPNPSATGVSGGPTTITATVGDAEDSTLLTVTEAAPSPSITRQAPTTGPVGTAVTITGSNFGSSQGASTVTFNGVDAGAIPDANWNDTLIIAIVPAGATTGPVVVTVNGVPSNGAAFTVTPAGGGGGALAMTPTSATVPANNPVFFGAIGGTPPYTFSFVTNQSGGSINAATGLYTAGGTADMDTVQVEDSALPTHNMTQATVTVTATVAGAVMVSLDGRALAALSAGQTFSVSGNGLAFSVLSTDRVHELNLLPGTYTLTAGARSLNFAVGTTDCTVTLP